MPRRRHSKASNFWVAFWITPVAAVALLQLHLHASTNDPSELSDGHLLAVLVLLGLLFSLSCLGCALDAACSSNCPQSVPVGIFAAQIALLCTGLVLDCLHVDSGKALAGILQTTPEPRELPLMVPIMQAASLLGEQTEDSRSLRSAQPRASAAAGALAVAAPPQPRSSPPDDEPWPSMLNDKEGVPAWRDVGIGYCEDKDTKDEYSALHAKGKTLQECADFGLSDESSIAFDFSRVDGGCDIRYPAGSLAAEIEGFEWYGWGAGKGEPVAHGKRKHDAVARCYVKLAQSKAAKPATSGVRAPTTRLHPHYRALIREYSFKPVTTQQGHYVNVVLVRAPLSDHEQQLFNDLKDELLFIGISCLEDFPLPPPNPFSPKYPADKFVGMFPGFLNMYRNPENIYPRHVKILDMSQSDFYLPSPHEPLPKKYDFTFSGSDQDIGQAAESECVGWSMFCKNWSFAKQALEVMCGELGMTGVLVATKDKQDKNRCSIPKSCEGKMVQTTYLPRQEDFFTYVRQSRFLFLPQVHDASPRVASQALALDVPLLMNRNLIGGWKYLNEKTGEFFNDLSDFRGSLQRLLRNVEAGNVYEPRKWVTAHYGNEISGTRLKNFIEENFRDRVELPEGTSLLFSGA